jgi:hypothetical protein
VAWFVDHASSQGSVLQSLSGQRDFNVINPLLGLS